MTLKIDQPIVGYSVVKQEEEITPPPVVVVTEQPKKRPKVLYGETHKITNHAKGYNLYLTINYNDGKPFEVFIDSSHTESVEFIKAISRMASAMLRTTHFDLGFVAKELMKIHSDQGYHAGGKNGYVSGIVQHIGKTLLQVHKSLSEKGTLPTPPVVVEEPSDGFLECPQCHEQTMVIMDGCPTCTSTDCAYSKCS